MALQKIENHWSRESQTCPKLKNNMIKDAPYWCSMNMDGWMDDGWLDGWMSGWTDAIIEEYVGGTEEGATNSAWGRRRAKIPRSS